MLTEPKIDKRTNRCCTRKGAKQGRKRNEKIIQL